jgi:hypothetical protein
MSSINTTAGLVAAPVKDINGGIIASTANVDESWGSGRGVVGDVTARSFILCMFSSNFQLLTIILPMAPKRKKRAVGAARDSQIVASDGVATR